jgi:lipoate-protein ligase A
LAEAYARLGVDAELTSRPRGSRDSAACYLHATRADLSLGLRKLSGSAQVWLGDSVLQHGSFTITRDIDREAAVFGLSPQERERLAEETVTLATALGSAPSRDLVRAAVAEGFAASLGIDFEPARPSKGELATASRLHAEMLATPLVDPGSAGSR